MKILLIDTCFLATAITIAKMSDHARVVNLDFVVLFFVFIILKIILSVLEHLEEMW